MSRQHKDWLAAFTEFASYGEAPPYVYFWIGVSTIAGALRRKVWIDQVYYKWFPNHYIILVAPPGEIAKTTTTGIGMNLLKKVDGVHFGPNVVTWPALVKHLGDCNECFTTPEGEAMEMAPLTIHSGELGNLLNPSDREMVDMLTTLWDGGDIHKVTKTSGSDDIKNPILNMLGCTTPSWINASVPEYFLGGGFLSRCLFVHADKKARYVAYPGQNIPADFYQQSSLLVQDLTEMADLSGEMAMTKSAIEFGERWYEELCQETREAPVSLKNFMARKQSHVQKLAMILSVSRGNDLIITEDDMKNAVKYLTELQPFMMDVLDSIGKTTDSKHADAVVEAVRKNGPMKGPEFQKLVHKMYPKHTQAEEIISGLLTAGLLVCNQGAGHSIWKVA